MLNQNKDTKPNETAPELKQDRDDSLGYSRQEFEIEPEKPPKAKKKLVKKKRKK